MWIQQPHGSGEKRHGREPDTTELRGTFDLYSFYLHRSHHWPIKLNVVRDDYILLLLWANMSTGALFHDEMIETTGVACPVLVYRSKCLPDGGV